jgi:hypothetical protein
MDLTDALAAYAAGLDAELGILNQVESLARSQRRASQGDDLEQIAGLADRRSRLMAALADLELRLQPIRAMILAGFPRVRALAGFAAASARHREAAALVQRIQASDHDLLAELQAALAARRQLAHDLEAGGATLAAYRRVIAPGVASAGLVDRQA